MKTQVTKTDFKKEIATYSAPMARCEIVTVPPLQFIAIDGHGDPNTAPEYRDAVTSLYPLAYALKFFSRAKLGLDFVVMPLEGLWWADDMAAFSTARDKTAWNWTLMIMVPQWLTADYVAATQKSVAVKGAAPAIGAARLERFDEGLVVQTLHVGPYDAEGPTIEKMHSQFIPDHGLAMTGKHHEIYLSDPRRVSPDKLRTIVRQPVLHQPVAPAASA